MSEADTPAKRVYLVRLACGDGLRTAMPMAAFAKLVKRKSPSVAMDSGKVSRIENAEQPLSLDDIEALARVDPKRRGPAWIAYGITTERAPTAAEALANAEEGETYIPPAARRKKSS